jgi:hypothetical protein
MNIFTKIKDWWKTHYRYYAKVVSVSEVPYFAYNDFAKQSCIRRDYIYELKIVRYDKHSSQDYPIGSVFRIKFIDDPIFERPDDYNKKPKLFDKIVYYDLKYAERIG